MSEPGNATISSPKETDGRVFDLWAQIYDAQLNPLLMLEERYLEPLLPCLQGREVLDVGCGTGRWLCRLEALEPARLVGADCSSAMLDAARKKIRSSTGLHQVDCSVFPSDDRSKTLVLASFVLSHLGSLDAFAKECDRVTRPGGYVLFSDMHPVTAAALGWKRDFRIDGMKIEIATQPWSLDEIISTLRQHGFELQTLIEPAFDIPERPIFESSGKLSCFEELAGVPAIYIMKLQKRASSSPTLFGTGTVHGLQFVGARVALGADTWKEIDVTTEGAQILSIGTSIRSACPVLDLSAYLILPGLVNAHDHLEFGLFPNLGRGADAPPYRNSEEWAHEIHELHAATIDLHQQVPKAVRLRWGAIRNLLCGVTTVCHHNPLHPDFELAEFPVKVVNQFEWSHSLRFDSRLCKRFSESSSTRPFIFHAAEGIDEESRDEIYQLDNLHLLDRRTVLVHGLGLTRKTASLINRRGASLVTCPTSNRFLFSEMLSRNLLESVERVAVGSDSPLTAAGDLLNEIRCLHFDIGLDAASIYNMVTRNSARILRLQTGAGQIIESGPANLIAIRRQQGTPASVLSALTFDQIELSIISGRVQMASPSIYEQLPQKLRSNMQLMEAGGHLRWLRAPLHALFEAAESVLGKGNLRLSGRQVHLA